MYIIETDITDYTVALFIHNYRKYQGKLYIFKSNDLWNLKLNNLIFQSRSWMLIIYLMRYFIVIYNITYNDSFNPP